MSVHIECSEAAEFIDRQKLYRDVGAAANPSRAGALANHHLSGACHALCIDAEPGLAATCTTQLVRLHEPNDTTTGEIRTARLADSVGCM